MKTKIFAASMLVGLGGLAMQAEHLKSLSAEGIDPNIPAATDFYHHVNAKWQASHPLSPEYSRYGQFNILTDSSNNRVRRIVAGIGDTNPAPGTVAYKIASLYQSGMDSVRRNTLGAQPIAAGVKKIQETPHEGMEDLLVWMHKYYASPFFTVMLQEDLNNSAVYAMYAGGPSIMLGDRDYYLKNDKDTKKIRDAYKTLITKQMQLVGLSKKDASRVANNVLKIETIMADSVWTREQSRDLNAMNNVRDYTFLTTNYPNVPWDRIFKEAMGIETPEEYIVTDMSNLTQGNMLLGTLSDREKKDLYLWQYVSGAAPYLSDDFANAAFEFDKVMSGIEQQQPRWKKVQGITENRLGEAIGQLYVEQYFPESSKIYMEGLVENLRTALGKHILHLPWMSDDTKLQAIKKLNAITVKIGYPDKWKDYSTMDINPELSFYENVHNADMWLNDEYLAKWGKPVDRTEWQMTPQTINAYYNPLNNEIVFPAGILQAPFFDGEASDAENYGGIGVVIGHELTHGFDDQGCNFDAVGNMNNWWTAEDAEAFTQMTKGLADQFDKVEVLPGLMANGAYTLGENIADQGGLRVAMTAFLDAQKKKGVDVDSEEALIEGLTPEQVFYMNYANLWAQNVREAEMRKLTMQDVHSLGINRVNVSLRNLQPFFDAFQIKEGDPMYRPESERVIIW